jgi:hypothetical protein
MNLKLAGFMWYLNPTSLVILWRREAGKKFIPLKIIRTRSL